MFEIEISSSIDIRIELLLAFPRYVVPTERLYVTGVLLWVIINRYKSLAVNWVYGVDIVFKL